MDRVRNLSLHMAGQYRRVIEQHRVIVDAMRSGNRQAVIAAMAVHLREVYKVLDRLPIDHPEFFI